MTNYKDKKIAVLGWGVDTEDIVPFLLDQGVDITVYDRKKSLDTKYTQALKWKLGSDDFGDLSTFDLIIRNPAVYRYRQEITSAEKSGVEISSKIKIFFDLCPAKIIGVTGTKGKGTTSTLIYEILKAGGKEVYLGGNIGKGVFEILPKLNKDSWVVLELSSFQLIDLHKSPHIAVVLMTTVEHQDWHASPREYINAKKPITRFQTEKDFTVYNVDYPNSVEIGESGGGNKFEVSTINSVSLGTWIANEDIYLQVLPGQVDLLCSVNDVKLRGWHNLENILAAGLTARLAGAAVDAISNVITNFKGLEHRLEEVRTVNGVTYFNDSFSTTPETTIAAVKSFAEPTILIAGGSEKGSDFTELGKTIVQQKNLKAVILIGLMAGRIKNAIEEAGKPEYLQIIEGAQNMSEIVKIASKLASEGGVVVLSPGAASFDMFKNYKNRGELFKAEVLKLKSRGSR